MQVNAHDKRLTAAGRSTTEMNENTNSSNSPLDLLVSLIFNWRIYGRRTLQD